MKNRVDKMVYNHICQTAFSQATSDQVYPGVVPQGVDNPVYRYMIQADRISNTKQEHTGGLSAVDFYSVTIDAYADTYSGASTMISDFIDNYTRTNSNYPEASISYDMCEIIYEDETDSYRGMMTFRLRWTNKII